VAARSILRLSRHLTHALDAVGLSPAQYRVLAMLAEGDGMASRIAGQMAVTKPSITALIDGLADRDLVERRPHPTDRRRRTLCITAAGVATLREADTIAGAGLESIAEHLPDADAGLEALASWDVAIRGYRAHQHAEAEAGRR
jgi:DNA-binding MarR family transcriptional regulator